MDVQEQNYKVWAKRILAVWLILAGVYFFMLCQLWWGNHDWGYLKNGVTLLDGAFEARYSQHLLSVVLFDGQVLPMLGLMVALVLAVGTGMLTGLYFGVPDRGCVYMAMALFTGLNPYIFALFYYVYLQLPFMFWGVLAILALFAAETPYRIWKFVAGAAAYGALWGGYPPVMAFGMTLFCARRAIDCANGRQSLRQGIFNALFCCGQAMLGALVAKGFIYWFQKIGALNSNMYNLQLRSAAEMGRKLWESIFVGFAQLWQEYCFLETWYCLPLAAGVSAAAAAVLHGAKGRRWQTVLWLAGMFAASRFAFIIAVKADMAAFRLAYFGRLGLSLFALSVLFQVRALWGRNIVWVAVWMLLLCFARTDFEIQKVWALGFDAGRRYQARLGERIIQLPGFDRNGNYVSFAFGQPNFRVRFGGGRTEKRETDMLGTLMTFPGHTGYQLFWDDTVSPLALGIQKIENGSFLLFELRNNPMKIPLLQTKAENVANIRWWLYTGADVYPSSNAFYVDDKYLFMILERQSFMTDRESLLKMLGK